MDSRYERMRAFVNDVFAELHKCSWPTRSELFEQTLLVIFSVAVLGLFVALVDVGARWLMQIATGTI